jgi:hypothetical protein
LTLDRRTDDVDGHFHVLGFDGLLSDYNVRLEQPGYAVSPTSLSLTHRLSTLRETLFAHVPGLEESASALLALSIRCFCVWNVQNGNLPLIRCRRRWMISAAFLEQTLLANLSGQPWLVRST